ncbi:hypothetical protein [Streptomyces sp. NPDC059371]|uniref:hypothetical protein n=1 Tax=Streptomyces sp. NPDC059371 TaxID=3346812 RepID=UPI0036C12DCF
MSTSAAVLCLGGLLAACGSGEDRGYAAVGAADGSPRASGVAVAPSGEVSLAPLDGSNHSGSRGSSGSGKEPSATGPGGGASTDGTGAANGSAGSTAGSAGSVGSSAGEAGSGTGTGTDGSGGTGTGADGGSSSSSGSSAGSSAGSSTGSSSGADSGRTGGSSGSSSTPPAPAPTASARPAALAVSEPTRAATDRRWCEKVTLSFSNTGGTAVRSGTVTFGTHIIGALGIDWATIRSTESLPSPIAAGARKSGTWTVCVDSWRVPLGMHVETQDVSVEWK